MIQKSFFFALFLILSQAVSAQNAALRGKLTDAENNAPLADATAVLSGTGKLAATDAGGVFAFEGLKPGKYTLILSQTGYFPLQIEVEVKAGVAAVAEYTLRRDPAPVATGDIPTVTLDEAESETEGAGEVANLLHASRDVFQNLSGFGWFAFRFRERGYDGSNFQTLLNGVPFNDPETGLTFFGEFGGLNDVLRNRYSTVGMDAADFAFSEIGGATNLDTRASVQRKQIRASYAVSNRAYRNRVMLTASTGLMPGGWAVSLSGSRRWAQEGYVPGTFFDGYSYFLSVDKKFSPKHNLNLTVFGAPNKRGRSADSYQEMYDIAGSNFYNPLWGYQNGEKRNAQVNRNHQPVGILRYDWNPTPKTALTAAAYAQTGKSGLTRLNWLNGANPAPDFNRRLPSSLLDPVQASVWAQQLGADEALRQINWATLYEANRRNPTTVLNADGQNGNTVSGSRSIYIVEDQRSDNTEAGANAYFTHTFNPRVFLNGGANYQWYKGRNFKVLDDLLGGDFWTDYDFFGQFDADTNPLGQNSDLAVPNNVIREGETFGFNYDENIRRAGVWGQTQVALRKFQFFAGFEAGNTNYWRDGKMQNGRFPDNSLGESEKLSFTTWGVKGGATWKINGRNYLYANGYTGQRAPQFRNAFLAPRTRDVTVSGLEMSTVQSVEGGYLLRSPNYKARLTAYYTNFLNETENVFGNAQTVSRVMESIDLGGLNLNDDDSFLQVPIFFGAAVMQGVDRRHAGVEVGIEAKPVPAWVFSAAASLGQFVYTSRPKLLLSLDNGATPVIDAGAVYQKDFFVPRTPQTAASVSVKHENRRFWFASLTLNYADNLYYDFDRVRRTALYAEGQDRESPVFRQIVDQQKAPSAFTLDFFGGKSWRFYGKYFLYLNAGINNLLNNKEIITGGRESYRNAFRNDISDPRFYATELFYAPGLNYFISLAIRY